MNVFYIENSFEKLEKVWVFSKAWVRVTSAASFSSKISFLQYIPLTFLIFDIFWHLNLCIMEVWNGNENCKTSFWSEPLIIFALKLILELENKLESEATKSWPKLCILGGIDWYRNSILRKYIFNPPSAPPSFCRLYLTKTKRAKLFVWKLPWPGDSEPGLATKLISSI